MSDWLDSVARGNAEVDHARRLQPGRNNPHVNEPPLSDYVVLLVVLVALFLGIF